MTPFSVIVLVMIAAGNVVAAQSISETRGLFRVKLVAIDDSGNLLQGATVRFAWGLLGNPKPDTDAKTLLSDEHGAAVFDGETRFGRYAYGAEKSGYYPTTGIKGAFLANAHGRWEPWDDTMRIQLRQIKNPVPMYAKDATGNLAAEDAWIGYDLQVGDWVAPWGQGERSDFEFRFEGTVEDNLNYDGRLTIRTPGEGNGIQVSEDESTKGSLLKMPYEAPQIGYITEWSWRNARITEKAPGATSQFIDESLPQRNFIFRVRSVLDAQGHVVSAFYGKIPGPFIFDPRSEKGFGYFKFKYYLNPDKTRNLEFDRERNLFQGQRITAP